jgi:hypothetical protein
VRLFQLIATPLVALLFLRSAHAFVRGKGSRGTALASALTWLLGGLCILKPDWTMRIASLLGIGRGADLLLYVLAMLFIASFFYYHGRFRAIDSQLTEIVRHLAITRPQHGSPSAKASPEEETSTQPPPA